MDSQPIEVAPLCLTHQSLLVQQAGVGPDGPWRSLLLVAQVVLFQMATTDPKVHARLGGDVHRFKELGCLACLHPDHFGEVVQAAQSPDPLAMKNLGLSYVNRSVANG